MKLRFMYVGIGLFLAGLIFTLNGELNFINSGFPNNSYENELDQKNNEIKKLRNEIKVAQKENTNNKAQNSNTDDATTDLNKNKNNDRTSEADSNSNKNPKEDKIVKGTVLIYENMSLYEIGQQVEDLNLIENGRQLELFLSKPEYSRVIQKGSFELSSDMTIEEMANILTGKTSQ